MTELDIKTLRQVELFEGLLPGHLKQVAAIVDVVNFTPGDKIFADGDPADSFYFVIKGKVRISKQVPGVGEEALAILEPGAYFGEMALIDDSPRSADAIANTTVKLGRIKRYAFEDLMFMNKDLAYDLLWTLLRTLSMRLRHTNDKLSSLLAMAGQF